MVVTYTAPCPQCGNDAQWTSTLRIEPPARIESLHIAVHCLCRTAADAA